MQSRLLFRWLPLVTAGLTASLFGLACEPDEQAQGEEGNGAFQYTCIDQSDPQCTSDDLGSPNTPFPTIALGGTFSLSYSGDSSYPTARVEPVSEDYFVTDGQDFTAIRTGTPSFYAVGSDGTVLDFVQVDVEEIQSIQVADTTSDLIDDTTVGATHEFTATAYGSVDQALGGRVLYEWASSDPSILEIEAGQPTPSATIKVKFRSKGRATLSAVSNQTSGKLDVAVSGGF